MTVCQNNHCIHPGFLKVQHLVGDCVWELERQHDILESAFLPPQKIRPEVGHLLNPIIKQRSAAKLLFRNWNFTTARLFFSLVHDNRHMLLLSSVASFYEYVSCSPHFFNGKLENTLAHFSRGRATKKSPLSDTVATGW